MAIYSCRQCQSEECVPRHYRLHFGVQARCPKCGTFRVVKLKERDKIDPMHSGALNLIERMAGGKLYHCRFCRLQFYDRRRKLAGAPAEEIQQPPQQTTAQSSAGS